MIGCINNMGRKKKIKILGEPIDLGEWTVPSSWYEVTLKQLQEIQNFYKDKDRSFNVKEVLHIFTDKTEDDINALPIQFAEKLLEHMMFLQQEPNWGEPTNKIVIDGEEYKIHFENQLKTGEYVAADAVIKSDDTNYAAILGILCRKEGEIYDSHYENEVLPSRIEMFERQSVTKVMPLVAFFLTLSEISILPTLLSSKMEEAVNHIAKNGEISLRNGDLSALSILYQTRKLKKSLESIKNI